MLASNNPTTQTQSTKRKPIKPHQQRICDNLYGANPVYLSLSMTEYSEATYADLAARYEAQIDQLITAFNEALFNGQTTAPNPQDLSLKGALEQLKDRLKFFQTGDKAVMEVLTVHLKYALEAIYLHLSIGSEADVSFKWHLAKALLHEKETIQALAKAEPMDLEDKVYELTEPKGYDLLVHVQTKLAKTAAKTVACQFFGPKQGSDPGIVSWLVNMNASRCHLRPIQCHIEQGVKGLNEQTQTQLHQAFVHHLHRLQTSDELINELTRTVIDLTPALTCLEQGTLFNDSTRDRLTQLNGATAYVASQQFQVMLHRLSSLGDPHSTSPLGYFDSLVQFEPKTQTFALDHEKVHLALIGCLANVGYLKTEVFADDALTLYLVNRDVNYSFVRLNQSQGITAYQALNDLLSPCEENEPFNFINEQALLDWMLAKKVPVSSLKVNTVQKNAPKDLLGWLIINNAPLLLRRFNQLAEQWFSNKQLTHDQACEVFHKIAIRRAIEHNRSEILKALLMKEGASDLKLPYKNLALTPLQLAAYINRLSLIDILVKHGVDKAQLKERVYPVTIKRHEGKAKLKLNLFHWALIAKRLNLVEKLKALDPSLLTEPCNQSPFKNHQPLHIAIKTNQPKMVTSLTNAFEVKNRLNIASMPMAHNGTYDTITPLEYALVNQQNRVVKALLKHTNLNKRKRMSAPPFKAYEPLHIAIQQQDVQSVKLLLGHQDVQKAVNVPIGNKKPQHNALSLAIKNKALKGNDGGLVTLLLNHSARLNKDALGALTSDLNQALTQIKTAVKSTDKRKPNTAEKASFEALLQPLIHALPRVNSLIQSHNLELREALTEQLTKLYMIVITNSKNHYLANLTGCLLDLCQKHPLPNVSSSSAIQAETTQLSAEDRQALTKLVETLQTTIQCQDNAYQSHGLFSTKQSTSHQTASNNPHCQRGNNALGG